MSRPAPVFHDGFFVKNSGEGVLQSVKMSAGTNHPPPLHCAVRGCTGNPHDVCVHCHKSHDPPIVDTDRTHPTRTNERNPRKPWEGAVLERTGLCHHCLLYCVKAVDDALNAGRASGAAPSSLGVALAKQPFSSYWPTILAMGVTRFRMTRKVEIKLEGDHIVFSHNGEVQAFPSPSDALRCCKTGCSNFAVASNLDGDLTELMVQGTSRCKTHTMLCGVADCKSVRQTTTREDYHTNYYDHCKHHLQGG
jgi:hypothetical protein